MDIQKFEFVNYDVDIEIGGITFKMDCASETGDYLKKCGAELRDLADSIGRGEKTIDDAVSYGCNMLDTLLGEGAAEKVFSGRKKRLSDVTDICLFLTQVAAKFQNERIKATQNRAQRRSDKKKK